MIPIMIIGWIRWAVILFLLLTVIYAVLTFTNRSKAKDRIKADYATSGSALTEKEFVDVGMGKYNRSLRAKLVLGVYLFPLVVFGLLIYFAHV